MMKARHMPFPITPLRAEAWLSCMTEAMDEVGLEEQIRDFYYKRLVLTAHHMVNRNRRVISESHIINGKLDKSFSRNETD